MTDRHQNEHAGPRAIHDTPPRGACQELLAKIWCEILHVKTIRASDDFFALAGSSSAHAVASLIQKLRGNFGIDVTPADIAAAPTFEALASALDRGQFPMLHHTLTLLQQGDAEVAPVFFLPGIRGHVTSLIDLAQALDSRQTVYGLQPRGLDGTAPYHESIQEIAAFFIDAIHSVAPHGPYFLVGYSAGGIVAFEMAQQLRTANQSVAFLGLLDAPAPGYSPQSKRVLWHIKRLFKQSPRSAFAYASQRLSNLARRLRRARQSLPLGGAPQVGSPLWRILQAESAFFHAMHRYTPTTLDSNLLMFTAEDGFKMDDPTLGWSKLASRGVEVVQIPGNHVQMMKPPGVSSLGKEIQTRLTRAQAAARA